MSRVSRDQSTVSAGPGGGSSTWQGKAAVSWRGWNGVRAGFTYWRKPPVPASRTDRVTATSVRPPANTQWWPFTAQPSSTFTTTSTLESRKNQK